MCNMEINNWKPSTQTPPHLKIVVGFYPDYDTDDDRRFQLVYFDERYGEWMDSRDGDPCAEPDQWAVINDPGTSIDSMEFKTGEWVHWVETMRRGSSVRVLAREGMILALNPAGVATVKLRNGRTREVAVSQLKRDPDAGELTEFVGALAGR